MHQRRAAQRLAHGHALAFRIRVMMTAPFVDVMIEDEIPGNENGFVHKRRNPPCAGVFLRYRVLCSASSSTSAFTREFFGVHFLASNASASSCSKICVRDRTVGACRVKIVCS